MPACVAEGASAQLLAPRTRHHPLVTWCVQVFMRVSVIAFDALVLLPACFWYFLRYQADAPRSDAKPTSTAPPTARTTPSAPSLSGDHYRWMRAGASAFIVACCPALLVIDHGHFQYNNVSLCAALVGMLAAAHDHGALAALAFTLALNYKQIALYYAPAFFVVLLAAAVARGTASLRARCCAARAPAPARSRMPTPWLSTLTTVACLGAIVLGVTAALWAPFCVRQAAGQCGHGVSVVLHRLFPFNRSIFEDKVSNIWCALDPLLRWRARIYAGVPGVRSTVSAVCAATTLLLASPALRTLWRTARTPPPAARASPAASLRTTSLLLGFSNVSLAFFLAAYQVHEKGILFPLAPLLLCAAHVPAYAAWFNSMALFSMWPLLAKDGLLVPAAAVYTLYALLAAPAPLWRTRAFAREAALLCAWWSRDGAHSNPRTAHHTAHRTAHVLRVGCCASLAAVAACAAASLLLTPPRTLPDLFPYASAVAAAASLCAALCLGTCLQAATAAAALEAEGAVATENAPLVARPRGALKEE
ncbi:hypothetical protein EON68_00255 [archaeon]|nr:MAG: hypothetical protein EON68_00255 [archaeon]